MSSFNLLLLFLPPPCPAANGDQATAIQWCSFVLQTVNQGWNCDLPHVWLGSITNYPSSLLAKERYTKPKDWETVKNAYMDMCKYICCKLAIPSTVWCIYIS